MVTTDFTETGNSAVAYAFDFASKLGASVLIATVIEKERHGSQGYIDYTPKIKDDDFLRSISIAEKISSAVPKEYDGKVEYDKVIIPDDQIIHGIKQAVAQYNPTVLIMAEGNRNFLAKLLTDNIPEKIIKHINCPVLITFGQTRFEG